MARSRFRYRKSKTEDCPEAVKAGHGIYGSRGKNDSGISEFNGSSRTIKIIDSESSVALLKRVSYRLAPPPATLD
jgi:hypothetical protein